MANNTKRNIGISSLAIGILIKLKFFLEGFAMYQIFSSSLGSLDLPSLLIIVGVYLLIMHYIETNTGRK